MLSLPTDQDVESAARRLRASLTTPGLRTAVAAYFNESGFAGMTFSDLGHNPPRLFTADELLARKRPRLCPISDSLVIKAVDVPGRTWDVLRHLLQDQGARADVEALRPAAAADATLLWILDVALWVSRSKSAAAQEIRLAAGLPS